jgi:L-asparaginase
VPEYGGPGGGHSLLEAGAILGGDLTGPKARVALMFALGSGMNTDAIRGWFKLVA